MLENDYYGDKFKWFVGVVKETTEDQNRVKVRIFGIHHINDTVNVSDGDLPLALVLYPTTGGQSGSGHISHGLTPGTWVVGFFADGEDCQQPIIIGVIGGGNQSTNNSTTSSNNNNGTSSSSSSGSSSSSNTTTNSANITGTTNLSGNTRIQQAYNFFYEKISKSGRSGGNIAAQVSGLIGNLLEESSLNPNSPLGDNGTAFGIAQWRGARRSRLTSMFGANPSYAQQLEFVWYELTGNFPGSETSAGKRWLAATTVEQAVDAIVTYERPACYRGSYINKNHVTYPGRLKKALSVYNSVKYTGSSGGNSNQTPQTLPSGV